jgi:hypothetical protein
MIKVVKGTVLKILERGSNGRADGKWSKKEFTLITKNRKKILTTHAIKFGLKLDQNISFSKKIIPELINDFIYN